jgi:hypothetical protein
MRRRRPGWPPGARGEGRSRRAAGERGLESRGLSRGCRADGSRGRGRAVTGAGRRGRGSAGRDHACLPLSREGSCGSAAGPATGLPPLLNGGHRSGTVPESHRLRDHAAGGDGTRLAQAGPGGRDSPQGSRGGPRAAAAATAARRCRAAAVATAARRGGGHGDKRQCRAGRQTDPPRLLRRPPRQPTAHSRRRRSRDVSGTDATPTSASLHRRGARRGRARRRRGGPGTGRVPGHGGLEHVRPHAQLHRGQRHLPVAAARAALAGYRNLGYTTSGYSGSSFTKTQVLSRTLSDWGYYVRPSRGQIRA